MTEDEKKARINYVNDFMYEHGFCNVYNDIDVPKLYIADLLDSMREDAYKQAIDDFENKILSNCAGMLKDGDRVIVIRMDIFKFILEQLKDGGEG